jgi:hypothetical protein
VARARSGIAHTQHPSFSEVSPEAAHIAAAWFERLLAEWGFELRIGGPAEFKAKGVKKQRFDREDSRLLLKLFGENNFLATRSPRSQPTSCCPPSTS